MLLTHHHFRFFGLGGAVEYQKLFDYGDGAGLDLAGSAERFGSLLPTPVMP
jgi:hypothetical protein